VDWHPHKALLASGGKDSLVKLWDAKSGTSVANIHAHKNMVTCCKWNANGNWLATGCKVWPSKQCSPRHPNTFNLRFVLSGTLCDEANLGDNL